MGVMKVQINSDKQVVVDAELSSVVEAEVRRALGRFETQLTRLEVHLSDLNSSSKRGLRDKRCLLEARPVGRKPVSVAFETASVEQAVRGAAGKMKRLLETSFGKSSGLTSQRSARQTKRASSSSASLEKLQRIQTALSEVLNRAAGDSPRLERYMKTASNAVNEARLLVESQNEKAETATSKRTAVPVKRIASVTESSAAGGRSRKKKGIYQARRKAWPGR
jgi:predicted component of type VI protein secretion system